MTIRQTNSHTDKLITILRTPVATAAAVVVVKTAYFVLRRNCAESNDGKHEPFRFHLQQQVVHRHFYHSLPQQKGSFSGEDQEVAANSLFLGVHR